MRAWCARRRRRARPVHPRARGLGAQRGDQRRRPLGGVGGRPRDRAADPHQHLDRPACAAGGGRAGARAPAPPTAGSPRCATTRPARWACATTWDASWVSRLGLPIVNLPGCPVQPDNITETLLYLVLHIARHGARARARRAGAAPADLRPHRARGMRPRRPGRAGAVLEHPRRRALPGQARLQGAGRQVQRAGPRLDQRDRRLPQRRRDLHGVHDAGVPRQVPAVLRARRGRRLYARTARFAHGPVVRYLRARRIRRTFDVEPRSGDTARRPAARPPTELCRLAVRSVLGGDPAR